MIKTANLTKRFGAKTVVDDVSFLVEPGTVTGFLGANGAGKSTTLRMLTGLSRAGRRRLDRAGRPVPRPAQPGTSRRRPARRRRAARRPARPRGAGGLRAADGGRLRRAATLLDLVGLDRSAARKRVRHYSLGMRQRLGIAHALLGDPEVLILDEPANGLDPPGIRWMRELLRDFADRGGTVLLSSHLLNEVQALADRVVIIDLGRIVAEGSLGELLASSGTVVRGDDDERLRSALDAAGLDPRPAIDGGFVVEARPEPSAGPLSRPALR